jgi:hypothetical protein
MNERAVELLHWVAAVCRTKYATHRRGISMHTDNSDKVIEGFWLPADMILHCMRRWPLSHLGQHRDPLANVLRVTWANLWDHCTYLFVTLKWPSAGITGELRALRLRYVATPRLIKELKARVTSSRKV